MPALYIISSLKLGNMQRGKRIMNLISQYKGLRKENYVLCFGRFVTAMGAMVRPMLTMILSRAGCLDHGTDGDPDDPGKSDWWKDGRSF